MLCWGYWSLGQPGISPSLQGVVAEPQVCGFISDRSVKEVACGGNHSVFLLEDGEVYTCGVNTKGQLGHEREGNKPGLRSMDHAMYTFMCTTHLMLHEMKPLQASDSKDLQMAPW
ncbi:hypothetical protein FD754_022129 [Muntiacus muntjak]|uniref:HECT domain-containing protein n=1 Tax=Muntiacus muntjak TaxID=9888 RepID=A0A5N3V7P0_MUNMU|nr:hypothetical protein FD754_022129 [Muntiacus muntjak]